MKARLGILPLALVGVGCSSLRPWTPSVSIAFWAEDVPRNREYTLPSAIDLASMWQVTSESPWSRYHKGTLISAVGPMLGEAMLPDVRSLDVVADADAAAAHVAQVGLPSNTIWLLDLRGAASAAFASRLSRSSHEPIAPVVTFNNWPAEDSLIPADETLAGLVAFPPVLPPPGDVDRAHPVFLLDSWRLAFRFDEPEDQTLDNRYMLMPSDLPDAATLKERGITRVIYVVEDLDDAEMEEDDLNASFRAWQAADASIFMVDLAFLKEVQAAHDGTWRVDWTARLAPQGYWVRERHTLADDPHFYVRARSGFGLASGRPAIHSHGGGWSGGSGG